MITLQKDNQVYTVSEDTALYRQLVDNGFEEIKESDGNESVEEVEETETPEGAEETEKSEKKEKKKKGAD